MLQVRVKLGLVDGGYYLGGLQDNLKVLYLEVGDTDGSRLTGSLDGLYYSNQISALPSGTKSIACMKYPISQCYNNAKGPSFDSYSLCAQIFCRPSGEPAENGT